MAAGRRSTVARGVVFDFDGTLAETRDAVVATIHDVLVQAGHPRVAPRWVHGMMGLPLELLLSKAIPRTQRPADLGPLVDAYRARFAVVGLAKVRPMPEADAVLSALRDAGWGLALATSREASTLAPILDRFGWRGGFVAEATGERVAHGKPAPDLLAMALDEAGWAAEDCVMVGDTRWDMEMASAAGVRAVGVAHGSHDADTLRGAGACVVLPDLRGLPGWLAGAGSGG